LADVTLPKLQMVTTDHSQMQILSWLSQW